MVQCTYSPQCRFKIQSRSSSWSHSSSPTKCTGAPMSSSPFTPEKKSDGRGMCRYGGRGTRANGWTKLRFVLRRVYSEMAGEQALARSK